MIRAPRFAMRRLLACWLAARRAVPIEALRYE
jgi:hypothetical protein